MRVRALKIYLEHIEFAYKKTKDDYNLEVMFHKKDDSQSHIRGFPDKKISYNEEFEESLVIVNVNFLLYVKLNIMTFQIFFHQYYWTIEIHNRKKIRLL